MITDKEIDLAVSQLLEQDPMAVLTPLRIYHLLGRRPRCGNCMPLVVALMHRQGRLLRDD